MRLLVEHGADPLRANITGDTPLLAASGLVIEKPGESPGSPEEVAAAVKFLLDLGADATTVDDDGNTAFTASPYGDRMARSRCWCRRREARREEREGADALADRRGRRVRRRSARDSRIPLRFSTPDGGTRPESRIGLNTHSGFGTLAAIACALSMSAAPAAQADRGAPPTFNKDIAPILFSRCSACHRPDGPAPFDLLSFDAAKRRAGQIAEVTRARLMPPWKAEPGFGGDFVGSTPALT